MIVVFPDPLGPIKEKNSPSLTFRLRSFTAEKSEKLLFKFLISNILCIININYFNYSKKNSSVKAVFDKIKKPLTNVKIFF
jgi:hypothetical protein